MFLKQHYKGPVVTCASVLIGLAACAAPDAPFDAQLEPALQHAAHASASTGAELAGLRQVTARFQYFEEALAAGYEAQITPCWAHQTDGSMGYHYGKPDLIEDGVVSLLEPELLMYEPQPGGHMKLVGMEYIVFLDDWEGSDPPTLLGQQFTQHSTLPIYKLHIWLWRNNPQGTFADWNPKVSCAFADETQVFD